MPRNRRLRQRPLKVYASPRQRLRTAMEELSRRKIIRQLVIETARKNGIEVDDQKSPDATE